MKFPKLRTIGTSLGLAGLLLGGSACSKRGQETNNPDEVVGGYLHHKAHILKDSRKSLEEAITSKKQTPAQTVKPVKPDANPSQNTATEIKSEPPQEIRSQKTQETKVVKKRPTPPPIPNVVAKKAKPKPAVARSIPSVAKVEDEVKGKGKDEEIMELELCEVEFIDDIKPLTGPIHATSIQHQKKDDERKGAMIGAPIQQGGNGGEGGISTLESEKLISDIKILGLTRQKIIDLMACAGFMALAIYIMRRTRKELDGQKAAWLTLPLSLAHIAHPGLVKANIHTPESPKISSLGKVGRYKNYPTREGFSDGEDAIIFDTRETEEQGKWIDMEYEDRLKRIEREVESRNAKVGESETTFAPLRPEMFEQLGKAEDKTTKSHPQAGELKDGTVLNSTKANRAQDKGELAETEQIVDQFIRGRLVEDIPIPEPLNEGQFSQPPIALGESVEEARESGARWKKIKGEWGSVFDPDEEKNGNEGENVDEKAILEAKEDNKNTPYNSALDPNKGEILEAKKAENEPDLPRNPFAAWGTGESTLPLGTIAIAQMFMDKNKTQDNVSHSGHEALPETTGEEKGDDDVSGSDSPSENHQELVRTGESTLPPGISEATTFFRNMERLQAEPDELDTDGTPSADKLFQEIVAEAYIDLHIPPKFSEEGWHGLGTMAPKVGMNKKGGGAEKGMVPSVEGWEDVMNNYTDLPPLTAKLHEIAKNKPNSSNNITHSSPGAMGRNNNKDEEGTDDKPQGTLELQNAEDEPFSNQDNDRLATNNVDEYDDEENDWSKI